MPQKTIFRFNVLPINGRLLLFDFTKITQIKVRCLSLLLNLKNAINGSINLASSHFTLVNSFL